MQHLVKFLASNGQEVGVEGKLLLRSYFKECFEVDVCWVDFGLSKKWSSFQVLFFHVLLYFLILCWNIFSERNRNLLKKLKSWKDRVMSSRNNLDASVQKKEILKIVWEKQGDLCFSFFYCIFWQFLKTFSCFTVLSLSCLKNLRNVVFFSVSIFEWWVLSQECSFRGVYEKASNEARQCEALPRPEGISDPPILDELPETDAAKAEYKNLEEFIAAAQEA